jgi:hypothetical protein
VEIDELGQIYQNILACAITWRENQSALIQAIHSSTLYVIHGVGEASLEPVIKALDEEDSGVQLDYSRSEIGSAVQELFDSEFLVLSGIFTKLFSDLKGHYFAGRLEVHRVIVMHAAPEAKLTSNLARVDEKLREIILVYDGWPEEMVSLLIDTMAHIAAGSDAESGWQEELVRLYELGAPARQRVEELDDAVEWPCERARCCAPEDRLGWQLH